MRRVGVSRSQLIDVLARPPYCGGSVSAWSASVVDPVEQLEELADLCDRGLMSPEEFEDQKAKVLHR